MSKAGTIIGVGAVAALIGGGVGLGVGWVLSEPIKAENAALEDRAEASEETIETCRVALDTMDSLFGEAVKISSDILSGASIWYLDDAAQDLVSGYEDVEGVYRECMGAGDDPRSV